MKFRITVNENFQTIETVVEAENSQALVPLMKELRNVIKQATSDVEEKKSSQKKESATTSQPKQRMATKNQIEYLIRLGVVVPENLTFDEARRMLDELGA